MKATECLNHRLTLLELNGLETLNITTAYSQARDGISARVNVANRFNTFETTARCVRTSACHKRLSFCHTPDGPLVRNILSPDDTRMNWEAVAERRLMLLCGACYFPRTTSWDGKRKAPALQVNDPVTAGCSAVAPVRSLKTNAPRQQNKRPITSARIRLTPPHSLLQLLLGHYRSRLQPIQTLSLQVDSPVVTTRLDHQGIPRGPGIRSVIRPHAPACLLERLELP